MVLGKKNLLSSFNNLRALLVEVYKPRSKDINAIGHSAIFSFFVKLIIVSLTSPRISFEIFNF